MKKSIHNKFIIMLIIITLSILAVGCSGSGNQEFTGVFSGEAGKISFSPDGQVNFDFNDDFKWMLGYSSNNNKILKYRFVSQDNSTVSYDKAEYMTLAGLEDNKFIISNPCKIEKDKLILYPGKSYETILIRETE